MADDKAEKVAAAMKTHTITVLDREIVVQPLLSLGLDKLRLFARIGLRLQQGKGTLDDILRLDTLIAKLLDPKDNQWLEDQILDEKLTTDQILEHLIPVFRWYEENAPKETVKATPPKKARRV